MHASGIDFISGAIFSIPISRFILVTEIESKRVVEFGVHSTGLIEPLESKKG